MLIKKNAKRIRIDSSISPGLLEIIKNEIDRTPSKGGIFHQSLKIIFKKWHAMSAKHLLGDPL